MIAGACSFSFLHHTFWLLPQKMVFWEHTKTLLVSDLHFGKDDSIRRAGSYLPPVDNDASFHLLSQTIHALQAERLIMLGDLFHDSASQSDRVLQSMRKWRMQHEKISMLLIRGNHDLKSGDPPEMFGLQVVDEPYEEEGIYFTHQPLHSETHFTFCGHIHPGVVLSGKGRQYLKVPCFFTEKNCMILPAFGALTGTVALKPGRKSKVYVVTGTSVVEMKPEGERDEIRK